MKTFACGGILLLTGLLLAQDARIELKTVKYDGLADHVLKNRGKVVLLDFWATY